MYCRPLVTAILFVGVTWGKELLNEEDSAEPSNCQSMLQVTKTPGANLKMYEAGPGQYTGHLTVHLDPHDVTSPKIQLEIFKWNASSKVPRAGALLAHMGGPGSTADGAGNVAFFVTQAGYDLYGISQRGIGKHAYPSFTSCNNFHLPPKRQGPYKVSDFTSCPCRLADGTPMIGEAWADVNPNSRTEVSKLFEKVAERSQRCRDSFDMNNFGFQGKGYNFLDYAGTQMLAHDIEELRTAIGEQTLNFWGISYGTYVAGVYASAYPQRVGKVIMDGNVVPMPEKTALASGCGAGLQQSINKLLYNCKEQASTCSLKNPDEDFRKLLKKMKKSKIVARTDSGKSFRLTVGMLGGWFQEQLVVDATTWGKVPKQLADLLSKDPKVSEKAAGEILDVKCYLQDPQTHKKTYTWRVYDVCIGAAHIGGGDHHGSSFMNQLGVLGADLAGRYTVNDAVGLWDAFHRKYRSMAAGPYVGILSGLFQWPVVPTPPAPLGNPNVKALIIGNLYDPSTSYHWSQQMHAVFPNGKMMTWQGVGHGLFAGYSDKGGKACLGHIFKFLSGTDDDIPNGHTCRMEGQIPTSLLEGQTSFTTYLAETEFGFRL